MKKLLLITLICVLVFGLAITAMAKVNLIFWQYPFVTVGDKELGWWEREVIAEFEAMYPEVEIELQIGPFTTGVQKVETLIAVGDAPDILFDSTVRTSTYLTRDLLYSFDDILTEEEKALYLTWVLEGSSNDRGLVIFPWISGNEPGLMVNEKLARRVGAYDLLPLDKPYRMWTPEEFEAFLVKCKPLIKEGIYPFGFPAANEQGDILIQTFMRQWGAKLFSEDSAKCTINSPEAVACLEWILHLHDEGLLFPNPESSTAGDLREAQLSDGLVIYKANIAFVLHDEFRVMISGPFVMHPVPEGLDPRLLGTFQGPVAFDNGDPEKAKYAKLFCKYLATKNPIIVGAFDALKTAKVHDNAEIVYAFSLGKYAGPHEGSRFPYYKEYRAMLFPEIQAIFTHLKTPAQALADLEDKVNALIK